jgi:hypothetical protein
MFALADENDETLKCNVCCLPMLKLFYLLSRLLATSQPKSRIQEFLTDLFTGLSGVFFGLKWNSIRYSPSNNSN